MQFSENWLRTWVEFDDYEVLAHQLTMAGLEVESLTPFAQTLDKVVVAQVLEVTKHPQADRLTICRVDVGAKEPLQIVCGAPNVAAKLKVPCALIDAHLTLPDGKTLTIRKSKLRDVDSEGMLCSATELGLSQQQAGLWVLPDDAPVGTLISDYWQFADRIWEVKTTPNRADCLSILGIAREVAMLNQQKLQWKPLPAIPATSKEKLPVRITDQKICGRFSGRIIRGVNSHAKTPGWMLQRLEKSGQRSISALVDISNYVMLELGRPSHIFDFDKLDTELTVRWAKAGEQITLLNGQTVELDEKVAVVADKQGPKALAGIMGGQDCAVSDDTKNIYLEAAFWWPEVIRGRARRYALSSEAAHRGERGVDYETTAEHVEYITSLIVSICGGEAAQLDDQITQLPSREPVMMRADRVRKVLGIDLTEKQIENILQQLGFVYELQAKQGKTIFKITPPSFRFDLCIEEDFIEEVARVYGFDNIPALPPIAQHKIVTESEQHRSLFAIRRQMADFDYQEVLNYSFVDEQWEQDFAPNVNPIRLQNPIAQQMAVMRSNLLGSLIANLRYNLNHRIQRVRIFEIASVYLRSRGQDAELAIAGFDQPQHLAALVYGDRLANDWGQKTSPLDFYDLKADLERLIAPATARFMPDQHPALHPGQSARIEVNQQVVGWIGTLHPRLQQKYELPLAPIVFEIEAAVLQQKILLGYKEVAKFPPVMRDLAFIVDRQILAQEILDTLCAQQKLNEACKIVQKVAVFDQYQGAGLAQEQKSLAFRVTLQDVDGTLDDTKIKTAIAALTTAVTMRHQAVLRMVDLSIS